MTGSQIRRLAECLRHRLPVLKQGATQADAEEIVREVLRANERGGDACCFKPGPRDTTEKAAYRPNGSVCECACHR